MADRLNLICNFARTERLYSTCGGENAAIVHEMIVAFDQNMLDFGEYRNAAIAKNSPF